jgi:hypothetical protein
MSEPCDPIRIEDVEKAQHDWCEGLKKISRAYHYEEDYHDAVDKMLAALYDFADGGRVFFRPTLAKYPFSFRTTIEGTRSYFIGEDPAFPEYEDGGFATNTYWVEATFSNEIEGRKAIQITENGTVAVAMGNVFLRAEGADKDVIVDKLFVYRRDTRCNLKLIAHMSAKRNEPSENAVE